VQRDRDAASGDAGARGLRSSSHNTNPAPAASTSNTAATMKNKLDWDDCVLSSPPAKLHSPQIPKPPSAAIASRIASARNTIFIRTPSDGDGLGKLIFLRLAIKK
jgi:hypothetical protein